MSFEQDVQIRANEKVAGLMDTLGDLIGNNGSLSTPLTALGGAALGGMAGKGLGMGGLGIGLGAALGGALGGVGANAINSQNMYQNMNDAAMINGISAGLNANDQTDMMQNQAIAQTNDTVNQLVGIVGDMMQGGMAMGGGMMPPADPSMMGMDPAMMGGQPPMDQGSMMPPPPSAPMSGQVDNNGLGMKQGSYNGFLIDVSNRVNQKLAEALEDTDLEGLDASSPEEVPVEESGNDVDPQQVLDIIQALTDGQQEDSSDIAEIAEMLGEEEPKMAGFNKQAFSIEDLKGITNTIAEGMIPQSLQDLNTVLNSVGIRPTSTRSSTLTRSTLNDENGNPVLSIMDDNIHAPVEFEGNPDSYINSNYY